MSSERESCIFEYAMRAFQGCQMRQDFECAASVTPEPITLAPEFLDVGHGDMVRRIAVRRRSGAAPGLLWLGGFKSDMGGTKAVAIDRWAAAHQRRCVRFDYS